MIWRMCEACGSISPEIDWINPHEWVIAGEVLEGATCPSCYSTRYVNSGEILLTEKASEECIRKSIM